MNGANSEVTFALDVNNLTDNADLQAASDYAVMYDTSAGAHRLKVELEHLGNPLAIVQVRNLMVRITIGNWTLVLLVQL